MDLRLSHRARVGVTGEWERKRGSRQTVWLSLTSQCVLQPPRASGSTLELGQVGPRDSQVPPPSIPAPAFCQSCRGECEPSELSLPRRGSIEEAPNPSRVQTSLGVVLLYLEASKGKESSSHIPDGGLTLVRIPLG